MKKLLLSFTAVLIFNCEGPAGPAGPAGEDGVANIHVEVIQLTSMNTQYIEYQGDNGTTGYLMYEHESDLVTQAVIDGGLVVVELSPDNGVVWFSLPYILYDGDNSEVDYMYTCEYAYTEGSVGISWWCSFDRTASDWMDIDDLWAIHYKISIITPN